MKYKIKLLKRILILFVSFFSVAFLVSVALLMLVLPSIIKSLQTVGKLELSVSGREILDVFFYFLFTAGGLLFITFLFLIIYIYSINNVYSEVPLIQSQMSNQQGLDTISPVQIQTNAPIIYPNMVKPAPVPMFRSPPRPIMPPYNMNRPMPPRPPIAPSSMNRSAPPPMPTRPPISPAPYNMNRPMPPRPPMSPSNINRPVGARPPMSPPSNMNRSMPQRPPMNPSNMNRPTSPMNASNMNAPRTVINKK